MYSNANTLLASIDKKLSNAFYRIKLRSEGAKVATNCCVKHFGGKFTFVFAAKI
jgi:hypothetical protein